jgi:tripartite-type tricarboxylate transporter receptor subunit TctC
MSVSPISDSRRSVFNSMLGLALMPIVTSGLSQTPEWPTKALTFVVPFPPGGSNDIAARLVSESVKQRIGQNIVIDNKSGANGALGVEAVLRAPKDNYTYLVASDSVSLIPIFRNTPWNLSTSFAPVAVLSYQPIVVVTSATSGIRSMKDLQAKAREKPNQIGYATSGQGSVQHLVGELFSIQMGIDLLHVPYRGGGQAVNDVIAGQVPVAVLGAAAVLPFIKSGKLVPLAVSTKNRSSILPEVPTLHESGAAEMDVPQWSALFAPEGTPAAVVAKLRRSVEESLAEPAMKQKFLNAAMDIIPTPPEAFKQKLTQDRERWSKLIKDRKISLE